MISSNPISVLFPAHVYSHSSHPEELVSHAAEAKHSPLSDLAFWWLNRLKYPPEKVSRTIICRSFLKISRFALSEVHIPQLGVWDSKALCTIQCTSSCQSTPAIKYQLIYLAGHKRMDVTMNETLHIPFLFCSCISFGQYWTQDSTD